MKQLNRNVAENYKTYPEKVLQFGTGNFLRGFTDWIIDRMNKEADFNGSVVIVQSTKNGKVDKINDQDGLYTLFLQGIVDGSPVKEHQVINSVSRGLNAYSQFDEYLALAASPDLRFVVSNTTEAGIAFDESDRLDDRPQKSFIGKLTAFLYQRYSAFKGDKSKGLIIIPCELIDQNGQKMKEVILQYVKLWELEEAFADWILESNTFCNTLVDRIVPGYPRDTIDQKTQELGYQDDLLVVGEQYHLWAIEGPEWLKEEFPAEKIGLNVKVVDDITPYRTSKVRILNGAHTAMTPVAYLFGIDTVSEAVTTPDTKQFIEELIAAEVIPVLDMPKDELKLFAKDVIDRFANPFIHHYFTSIALNAMTKFKTRNLPTLLEYVDQYGEAPKKIAFSLSAWIVFYKGKRGEENIELVDDEHILQFFKGQWDQYDGTEAGLQKIAAAVLGYMKLWDQDLNSIPLLAELVSEYLIKIEKLGMKQAIKDVL
ncbi:tagaturonate reductase [Mesobacillus harenae]|uniref:tagaturonate reductase n=1 Tax=Mesobacillus harenae TaxID=2213203 RepID=UPI00157FD939|nr:tagaturonate reductase [Mesobacillus harenae]